MSLDQKKTNLTQKCLGAKLCAVRKQAGLTRKDLSKLSLLPEATIKSWELNLRKPSLDNRYKLLNIFKEFGILMDIEFLSNDFLTTQNVQVGSNELSYSDNIIFKPIPFRKAVKIAIKETSNNKRNISLLEIFQKIEREYKKIIFKELEDDNEQ